MQSCGGHLRCPVACNTAHSRPVGPTTFVRRPEPRPPGACNASIANNATASTSGNVALPLGQLVTNIVDGARRTVVLQALKANRAMRREFASASLASSSTGSEPGLAMLAALAIPAVPGNGVTDLLTNRVFLVGFWSWFSAQSLKIFTKRFKKGVWDLGAMMESGGMPSSHSSLCAGITTAIAIQQGFGSALFAAALCFSVIVMYDAMGVRRHAGKQAEVLNKVIDELLDDDHPMGEVKLKEVLGHTPRQVICGGLLGLAVGLFFPA